MNANQPRVVMVTGATSGIGRAIANRFAAAGEQVIAIDISMKELEEAPGGFLKILMDASDLKFPSKTFQTVTAFFALMFMKPEIHKGVFAEVYRVLNGGVER